MTHHHIFATVLLMLSLQSVNAQDNSAQNTLERQSSSVVFTKPTMRWLWGGFGFHNSEASMTAIMTDEFLNQRVIKSFREISPTYSRVFAGFADWTKEAMDRFADYYDETFRKAGITLYLVPGRMPIITEDFDIKSYCENVASRLEYLIKERGCTGIRYYCATNELSVGFKYAWFSDHMDLYLELNKALQAAFLRHGLDVGLMTPDSSEFSKLPEVKWAMNNMNEQTEVYCWHYYANYWVPGDRKLYDTLTNALSALVRDAILLEKRVSLGEYGFRGNPEDPKNWKMRDDSYQPFRDRDTDYTRLAAITRVEMALSALNSGCISAVNWTFCDYPDPFLREMGDTPQEKDRYDVARFSGFGLDIRYNKCGLFKWCDEEHDYASNAELYTVGYFAKLFKKGSRVLPWTSEDATLRCGGITNPDGSASFVIVNWGEEKEVNAVLPIKTDKPLRIYEYDSANPPFNDFNDLQSPKGTVSLNEGKVSVVIPARSVTFLTSDYTDRTPSKVSGINLKNGVLSWSAVQDKEHVYYRVFNNGKQIASTVSTSLPVEGKGDYTVISVDQWGNTRH